MSFPVYKKINYLAPDRRPAELPCQLHFGAYIYTLTIQKNLFNLFRKARKYCHA